ncbi:UNVERIFIED_CONTAM: hypothetical protein Slati_0126400 [Sesamum latifolium]|uniref:Reverse transcriptase Ty1/copia-type domain-containing protein n=1 Tax=Sesamum latifolium TaxID=2727402 RepID=A0AAW2Y989_9LAMI
MQHESDALERNQTWDLYDLPADKKAIGSHWVYKVKLLPDGSVHRYKARLVAKSYSQLFRQLLAGFQDGNSQIVPGHRILSLLANFTARRE